MQLAQSAIFLAAAVVVVPLFKRLGLGSVLGYLAAGAVIGPSGLGLVEHVEDTLHVAEFGVVLLLFVIGLELQPKRLWEMRAGVFGLGSAQVAVTSVLLAAGAWLLGLPPAAALVVGFALSLSSTAFVLQVLGERLELTAPHGRASFKILLFQDLAAIPVLAAIPLLTGSGEGSEATQGPWMSLGIAAAVIAGLVLAGRVLLRPLFRWVLSTRVNELSSAWALLVVIGTALLMDLIHLEAALGAFLAGVLLADSEYRHELEADIEPFKGLLLGLFFVAVGMSADLGLIAAKPLQVLGIVLGLVTIKALALLAIGRLAKMPLGSAASLAIALSQGGEFAFVLFGVVKPAGLVTGEVIDLLVVAVTLSMMVTPLLLIARDRITARRAASNRREFDAIDEENPVIIAGFGRFGQIVGRVLRMTRIPFTALEVDTTQVDFLRRFGNEIYYGDAARVDLLRAAKADKARLIVVAIDDVEASMRTVEAVRRNFPELRIVARARNRPHAFRLMAHGAHVIVRETFLSSLDAARLSLQELGVTPSDAREYVKMFREHDERVLNEQYAIHEDEAALIASAKKFSADLERLFDADARQRPR
ncbi:monovalent cation:proton antiporter-2 (CPA2) family protein [Nannocystis pusilla]|uniref:monovalent cation:proton antiporter-2 (CPA2) family protein n=1 Tax=Nannocystis pusilla TaxID=889268 RepID=UPI003BF2648B